MQSFKDLKTLMRENRQKQATDFGGELDNYMRLIGDAVPSAPKPWLTAVANGLLILKNG